MTDNNVSIILVVLLALFAFSRIVQRAFDKARTKKILKELNEVKQGDLMLFYSDKIGLVSGGAGTYVKYNTPENDEYSLMLKEELAEKVLSILTIEDPDYGKFMEEYSKAKESCPQGLIYA